MKPGSRLVLMLSAVAWASQQHSTAAVPCTGRVSVCADPASAEASKPALSVCNDQAAAIAIAEFEGVSPAHGGWPMLRITSGAGIAHQSDLVRMRAAGLAEGYITQPWIAEMMRRIGSMRTPVARRQLRGFILQQHKHMRALLRGRGGSSERKEGPSPPPLLPGGAGATLTPAEYARVAGLFLAQVDGVLAGYNAAVSLSGARKLRLTDILELNYDGDAFDILQSVDSGIASFLPHRRGIGKAGGSAGARGSRGAAGSGFRFMSVADSSEAAEEHPQRVLSAASAGSAQEALAAAGTAPLPAAPLERLPSSTYDLESWVTLSTKGRCTAAIIAKTLATPGPDGLRVGVWAAHNTWADYLELVRVWKVYDIALGDPVIAAAHPASGRPGVALPPAAGIAAAGAAAGGARLRVSMSSYPGMVTSTDDWYQLGSGLLVTETTTSAVNARVLDSISPTRGLPAWLRATIANAVAVDGGAWADVFARHSGGTYNCMWLVLDARLVRAALTPASAVADLPARSLVVVEQSPRRVLAVDATPTLRQAGLWVSANRPSLALVRQDLGYPEEPAADATTLALPQPRQDGAGGAHASAARRGSTTATTAVSASAQTGSRLQVTTTVVTHEQLLPPAAPAKSSNLARFRDAALSGDGGPQAAQAGDDVAFDPSMRHFLASDDGTGSGSSAEWAGGLDFIAQGRAGEAVTAPTGSRGAEAGERHALPRFREREAGMAGSEVEASSAGTALTAASGSSSSSNSVSGAAGTAAAVKRSPPASYFSAFNSPRARILRREAAAVQSTADVLRLVRHNHWQGDAESQQRPYLAVSARFDLAGAGDKARAANGGIDAKAASLADMLSLRTHVVMGPTTDGQTPFDWHAWSAPGFCGATIESATACGAGATSHQNGKPIVDVRTLCSDGSSGAAGAAGAAAAAGVCPVSLPCQWAFRWGTVQA